MKNIIKSLVVIVAVAAIAAGASYSYFSDTKTADGNTFSAGTLKMKVDGGDTPVIYHFSNMKPGDQPNFTWKIKNDGSISGYLNIDNITFTDNNLSNVLNLRIMVDANCDGWYGTGDSILWEGLADSVPSSLKFNKAMAPGSEVCINNLVNWWSTDHDNAAQGETSTYGLSFELTQNSI